MTPERLWEAFCDHNLDLDPYNLTYTAWQFLDGKKRLRQACFVGAGGHKNSHLKPCENL